MAAPALTILYCDNHLLCLDKPAGLLTQPSGTDRDSLEARGKAWLKEQYNKPGAVFLEAAHRIDAPACGVVLFARTSKALTRLNASIREGLCRKEYRIWVEGEPKTPAATLRNWMIHDDHHARIVPRGTPDAKEAVLDYSVIKRENGASLIQVLLDSGRYHQIRVQFAHLGCPVLGDSRYGSHRPYRPDAIALQHYRLTIRHPVTKEELSFTSGITL